MKKRTMLPGDYYAPLLLLFTLFTCAFSFGYTMITGNASGDNSILLSRVAITVNLTHQYADINTSIEWTG